MSAFSPFEQMNRRDVKLFEWVVQFSALTLLVCKQMEKLFEQMSQYFERMLMYFKWIFKPFKQIVECFEQIFWGVWRNKEQVMNVLPVWTGDR